MRLRSPNLCTDVTEQSNNDVDLKRHCTCHVDSKFDREDCPHNDGPYCEKTAAISAGMRVRVIGKHSKRWQARSGIVLSLDAVFHGMDVRRGPGRIEVAHKSADDNNLHDARKYELGPYP